MIAPDHEAFAAATTAAGGVEPPLALALADALAALTAALGDLAYDLGGDPDTLRRHMTSLQAIDHITQSQIAIADILRSNQPVQHRLDAVTLETLATHLQNQYQLYLG